MLLFQIPFPAPKPILNPYPKLQKLQDIQLFNPSKPQGFASGVMSCGLHGEGMLVLGIKTVAVWYTKWQEMHLFHSLLFTTTWIVLLSWVLFKVLFSPNGRKQHHCTVANGLTCTRVVALKKSIKAFSKNLLGRACEAQWYRFILLAMSPNQPTSSAPLFGKTQPTHS